MEGRRPAKHVAITGASGGLGRALAEAYADGTTRLSLAGRDRGRLDECVASCAGLGAPAEGTAFDVRDTAALRRWLETADQAQPLDLVIVNAGVSSANGAEALEAVDDTVRVMEVNAVAAIAAGAVAAELMLPRGRGRIALVSSLAALYPMPSGPSYGAAKAAVRSYGLALGSWLRPKGVGVTVVCPGYVRTPMCDRLEGSKPFQWTAERAARHIRRRLDAGAREIVFPRVLAWGMRLLTLLPAFARDWFVGGFAYTVRPDAESPNRGTPPEGGR